MSKTVLLVGTRKGCFLLESDEARRDWKLRGPFCEGWPIYHAIHDPGSGTIYAAAASEWHGASVWRSPDLGETWEQSSEGLTYGEDGKLKLSKVSGLTAANGRLFAGAEMPGVFESRDGGETWTLLQHARRPAGPRVLERPGQPAAGPPRRAGDPPAPGRRRRATSRSSRASGSSRRPTTARRGRRGTRACAPTGRSSTRTSASASTSSSCRRRTATASTSRTTSACTAATTARSTWTEITEGLPTEFGFAAGDAPARPRHVLRHPARPRATAASCPRARRPSGARATRARAGSGSTTGLPQHDAHVGVLREGMAIDPYDEPGVYFGTSTGQVFASADEGDSWSEIASYLPAIASVEVAVLD